MSSSSYGKPEKFVVNLDTTHILPCKLKYGKNFIQHVTNHTGKILFVTIYLRKGQMLINTSGKIYFFLGTLTIECVCFKESFQINHSSFSSETNCDVL